MNEILLHNSIENFRQLLSSSYTGIVSAYKAYELESNSRQNDFADSFDDFFHDWAQSSWELLVERVICSGTDSLKIYGSGSDYEAAAYSRVFFHSLQSTHEVFCISLTKAIDSLTNETVDLSLYSFEGFVTVEQGWFAFAAPFNHVLLNEKNVYGGNYRQVAIPLDQITFKIKII